MFLFMPLQEMGILGPIASFSDSSAVRGGAAAPFASFLLRGIRTRNDNWLTQDSGLAFNSASGRTGMLRADGRVMAMRFASTTVVDVLPSGRTRVESHGAGDAGPFAARGRGGRLELVDTRPAEGTRLHLVVLPQPGAFIVADDRAMASNAMQMGVLGKYDSARFALVFVGPAVRVYRVQSGSVEREVPAP